MNTRLLKSVASLAAVVALGAGVTYAQFTSNTATVGASTMTSGNADLKLCNATGADVWRVQVNPGLSLTDLVPGAAERELTEGSELYVGNDNDDLDVNVLGAKCDAYGSGEPVGSSDVEMQVVPKVTYTTCPLASNLNLKFEIGTGSFSETKKISEWTGNATPYGLTLAVDQLRILKVYGSLDGSVTEPGSECTFDIVLTGNQVP